jgi:hydrogenase/urease accessory protein HupE
MRRFHIQRWAVLLQVCPWVAVVCYTMLSESANAAFLIHSTALATGVILSEEAAVKLQSRQNIQYVIGFTASALLINFLCAAAAKALHLLNNAKEIDLAATSLFFLVPYLLCGVCVWVVFYFSPPKS